MNTSLHCAKVRTLGLQTYLIEKARVTLCAIWPTCFSFIS